MVYFTVRCVPPVYTPHRRPRPKMPTKLHEAWAKTITPEDYEAHMAAVGQAQANAALTAEYLAARPPAHHASLLVAGAGTGQMFDFVSREILVPYNVTFTDINAAYLNRLRTRLAAIPTLRYSTVIDDIERPTLQRRFDTVLAILVLEHVDWHLAVSNLCALAERELFIITQQNPPDAPEPLTARRQVPQTMQIFAEVHPTLIPQAHLESEIATHGFTRSYAAQKSVVDSKIMQAIAFRRATLERGS
jgi:Methyltransferase domain